MYEETTLSGENLEKRICKKSKLNAEDIIHVFYFFGDLKRDKICLISLKNSS